MGIAIQKASGLVIPDTPSPGNFLEDLLGYIKVGKFIWNNPTSFTKQVTLIAIGPSVKETFLASPQNLFFSAKNYAFETINTSIPYLLQAAEISKYALQLMFSDLFEAFVQPLAQKEGSASQGMLTLGVIGAALIAHEFGIAKLKEDPEQAKFITYGAVTGAITSFIMDHDVCIGTLSGALVGLITDTALSCITYNSVTVFLKNQYKKLKIQERAEAVNKLSSQIFPYLFFTIGTALVYSQINPLISKIMEDTEIPSKKIHVIKVVATSGLLFGMGKSYLIPAIKSLLEHVKVGIYSAHDVGTTFSWGPRIFTIFLVTSFISNRK